MKDNPITNEAQAKTALAYVDYLFNELRAGDAGEAEMDLMLDRMVEVTTNIADYEYDNTKAKEDATKLKLVVDNGFVHPTKDLTAYRRTIMRVVTNTNIVNKVS